jgi:hypothetical protein
MHHVAKLATFDEWQMLDECALGVAFYFNHFAINGLRELLVTELEQNWSNGTLIALKVFRWRSSGSESQMAACLTLVG